LEETFPQKNPEVEVKLIGKSQIAFGNLMDGWGYLAVLRKSISWKEINK
jgi:hypothetical protein